MPHKIRSIWLIHHSHTDIGYTHPQPVVLELQRRFLDEALDLAERYPEFRWTCEVASMTRIWWEAASERDRRRFLDAVSRGQIEVAGMAWHLTPLIDDRLMLASMEDALFMRSLGVPVRHAMNTDVNGLPWGWVDVLLDHGIEGFSMGINGHWGGAPPRPRAFRWESPSGRLLPVWNGFQYWQMAALHLRIPGAIEEVRQALARVLPGLETSGYELPFLPLQITTASHPDNAGPDPSLPEFVREWNASSPDVEIRYSTLAEVFEALSAYELPVWRGDWTDYWNFGAGSTAQATVQYRRGLEALETASALSRETEIARRSARSLTLYAEHTWGADCSISDPDSLETQVQLVAKLAMAAEGFALARMARRDALASLAPDGGGDRRLLFFNPNPVSASRTVPVGTDKALEWYYSEGSPFPHRYDGLASRSRDPIVEPELWRYVRVEVPAFGSTSYALSELPEPPQDGVSFEDSTQTGTTIVRHGELETRFDTRVGGVLAFEGLETRPDGDLAFGVPVLQEIASGRRADVFCLDFAKLEPSECWVEGWRENRIFGRLESASTSSTRGCVRHAQTFALGKTAKLEAVYRFFAGEEGVEVELALDTFGSRVPHGISFPWVVAGQEAADFAYGTAGAEVAFDREQLPGTTRGFVTAEGWVRGQNEQSGLTISTPDCPLWMFGGLSFGRPGRTSGRSLLAWLSNNFWDTNFAASQCGRVVLRFRAFRHTPLELRDSLRLATPFMRAVVEHPYKGGSGSTEAVEGPEVVGVVCSAIRRVEGGWWLSVRNPSDAPQTGRVRLAGLGEAALETLAAEKPQPLRVENEQTSFTLEAREWRGLRLVVA